MSKVDMSQMEKRLEAWAFMMDMELPPQLKLYRIAEEEAKSGCYDSDVFRKIYEYEENRLSKKILHSAREKITARTRAHLILSLLLLDDGYEDAAVDSILEAIKGTHRVRQIKISALSNGQERPEDGRLQESQIDHKICQALGNLNEATELLEQDDFEGALQGIVLAWQTVMVKLCQS